MDNINNLLERFYRSLNGDERRKESIALIISKHTGGNISKEQIFYKDGVLEIEASAAMKNEIKIKEVEILKEIEISGAKVLRVMYR